MGNRAAFDEAMAEADGNQVLDELSQKDGEITIDDLRRLPGSEGQTDAELTAAWEASRVDDAIEADDDKEGAAAAQIAAVTGGEAVQTARGWKVYDDKGVEIADLSKMTAADFLKHKIGYNANGAEHRKSLDELTRVASYGHHNQAKLARVEAERERFYKELQEVRGENSTRGERERLLNYAFTQFHVGNEKPLKSLLDAYRTNMGGLPTAMQLPAPSSAPSSNRNLEADGLRYFHENIAPKADAIAQRYGAKTEEVRRAVQQLIEREPGETLTEDKINDIITKEIPYLLEDAGYSAGVTAPAAAGAAPAASELATLRQQIADLRAAMTNQTTDGIRQRNKGLPPGGKSVGSGSSDATPNDGSIPAEATQSAAEFKRYLKGR